MRLPAGGSKGIEAGARSSEWPTLCPAGANPKATAKKSLNKRKSRAVSAARTVSFSHWWDGMDSNHRPPRYKLGALTS